jgi:hypothetical protein
MSEEMRRFFKNGRRYQMAIYICCYYIKYMALLKYGSMWGITIRPLKILSDYEGDER